MLRRLINSPIKGEGINVDYKASILFNKKTNYDYYYKLIKYIIG